MSRKTKTKYYRASLLLCCVGQQITYLSVSRVPVAHESLVVWRRDVLGNVKRLVEKLKVRHAVADVDLRTLEILVVFVRG